MFTYFLTLCILIPELLGSFFYLLFALISLCLISITGKDELFMK